MVATIKWLWAFVHFVTPPEYFKNEVTLLIRVYGKHISITNIIYYNKNDEYIMNNIIASNIGMHTKDTTPYICNTSYITIIL